MVLPVWNPQNPSVGDKVARAIVYFVALIYMFLGMSIIADRFMSSIEVGKYLNAQQIPATAEMLRYESPPVILQYSSFR